MQLKRRMNGEGSGGLKLQCIAIVILLVSFKLNPPAGPLLDYQMINVMMLLVII